MLIKLTILGLVLTGLVLAIPTTRSVEEQLNQQIDRSDSKDETRRELIRNENREVKREENAGMKQEKRDSMMQKQDEAKKDERRNLDMSRRESDERKVNDQERRSVEETKEQEKRDSMENKEKEERRSVEETKEQEKRDSMENKEKEERRSMEMNDKSMSMEKRSATEQESVDEEKSEKKLRDVAINSTGVLSICESVTDFKYYQKYESDPSKYIQCDPWGSGHVKQCAEGKLWNEWTLECDVKEHIRNMTLDLSKFSITTAGQPSVNCSLIGMECHNGGSCVQSTSGDYKCACRSDYTGQYCESRVDMSDLTHEILNGTFSVTDYRQQLQKEHLVMNASYYEKYKDQLDNVTYSELINYLSMYKDGEVRYDALVNSLIEDILENIYPDAEYLSVFNASEQNVIAMVQIIPSLLSYSRYSFERYQDVFAQYHNVLAALERLLNSSFPGIQREATQYARLTAIFLNQTLELMKGIHPLVNEDSSISQPIQLTEEDIKHTLEVNYNETMKATEKLLAIWENFQNSVAKELEANPSGLVNMTLGAAKFAGAQEMLTILNEVSVASSQIWDSLLNYGFWYLTNAFSTSTNKVDSIHKFSLNLNKF